MKSILKKSKQIIIKKKKSQQCYLLAPYQSQTNKPFNTMSLLTMPFDSHRPMNNEKNSYTKNSISKWWGSRQKLSGLQGEILAKKTCLIFCSYYSINAPVFWPLEGLPILHLL